MCSHRLHSFDFTVHGQVTLSLGCVLVLRVILMCASGASCLCESGLISKEG